MIKPIFNNSVVNHYENDKEENRLIAGNGKVEFETTVKILNEHLPKKMKILDCAAGTGIYAFYLAEMGHEVTALDIVSRHIELIENELKSKPYSMKTQVNDARDLSLFEDESFDAVLCMGPLYHLTEEKDRLQCLSECIRVLKKGGLLFSAYINRFLVINFLVKNDFKYLKKEFIDNLVTTGVIKSDDPLSFWTDCYFDKPDIIEETYKSLGLQIIDHAATDGIPIIFRDKINMMNQDELKVWCDYHYATCREKSILGISNHGLIIGRKM